jgi:hypothetical protein
MKTYGPGLDGVLDRLEGKIGVTGIFLSSALSIMFIAVSIIVAFVLVMSCFAVTLIYVLFPTFFSF